jgi:uncharacterized RDD family membrane protein YckC
VLGGYPYASAPISTKPLPGDSPAPLLLPPGITLQESYAPFYASFGPRLAAALIDFFFMALLQLGVVAGVLWLGPAERPDEFTGWLLAYGPFVCLALALFAAYHIVQWTAWGSTIGKRLVGIKLVQGDGRKPGVGRSMLRMLGYFFSLSLAGWGFLMLVLDPRRQALHDKVAETYVVPEKPTVPAPAGLPGYAVSAVEPSATAGRVEGSATPSTALGMAAVATEAPFGLVQIAPAAEETLTSTSRLGVPLHGALGTETTGLISTSPIGRVAERAANIPEPSPEDTAETAEMADMSITPPGLIDAMGVESEPGRSLMPNAEKARVLFKLGLTEMERGVGKGLVGFKVEPAAARAAAGGFKEALDLVPNSVLYRYFYAVALRYSEGYEVAIREFRQVLELDPSHFEARQQIAYGPRWHDAFAYPAWRSPAPVPAGQPLPQDISTLLPQGNQPATRLVMLREGGTKCSIFLSRTPRSAWASDPSPEMEASLQLRLSRTPHGPIIALYVIVEDNPRNPYIGETFLNPHDPEHPTDDACRLGQHMLEQLARQDRTYLVFVDEENKLLLSRKLTFDSPTQVSMARVLYEVQSLPPQVMSIERFREAAQWHMQHFALDQLR